jgi:hypothetical protein
MMMRMRRAEIGPSSWMQMGEGLRRQRMAIIDPRIYKKKSNKNQVQKETWVRPYLRFLGAKTRSGATASI